MDEEAARTADEEAASPADEEAASHADKELLGKDQKKHDIQHSELVGMLNNLKTTAVGTLQTSVETKHTTAGLP